MVYPCNSSRRDSFQVCALSFELSPKLSMRLSVTSLTEIHSRGHSNCLLQVALARCEIINLKLRYCLRKVGNPRVRSIQCEARGRWRDKLSPEHDTVSGQSCNAHSNHPIAVLADRIVWAKSRLARDESCLSCTYHTLPQHGIRVHFRSGWRLESCQF